jgi:hypothetical protein
MGSTEVLLVESRCLRGNIALRMYMRLVSVKLVADMRKTSVCSAVPVQVAQAA